jgi:hypothetical protein
MNFGYRLRAWAATVSIVFNQTLHLGNAPYPYTLSETCWIRRHITRYAVGRAIIDGIFKAMLREADHCELSYYVGQSFRAKDQL